MSFFIDNLNEIKISIGINIIEIFESNSCDIPFSISTKTNIRWKKINPIFEKSKLVINFLKHWLQFFYNYFSYYNIYIIYNFMIEFLFNWV